MTFKKCGIIAGMILFVVVGFFGYPAQAQGTRYLTADSYQQSYSQAERNTRVPVQVRLKRERQARLTETVRKCFPWYLLIRVLLWAALLTLALMPLSKRGQQIIEQHLLSLLRQDGFSDGTQPPGPISHPLQQTHIPADIKILFGMVVALIIASKLLLIFMPSLMDIDPNALPSWQLFMIKNDLAWTALTFIACLAWLIWLMHLLYLSFDVPRVKKWLVQNGVQIMRKEGIVTAIQTKSTPQGEMYAPIVTLAESNEKSTSGLLIQKGNASTRSSHRRPRRNDPPEQIFSQRWGTARPQIGEKCIVTVDVLNPQHTHIKWKDGEEICPGLESMQWPKLKPSSGWGFWGCYAFCALMAFLVLMKLKY